MTGALEGVKVLDLTHFLAGPFCTQMLADHGADVIKVESSGGDFARSFGMPPGVKEGENDTYSLYFQSINRNKRSMVLDLAQEEGCGVLRRMVEQADVLVENFRKGVMERLGLSYEALHAINSKLVYATIRGFGDPRTGESPYVEWPCFDIIAQGVGGILSITGEPNGAPVKVGPGVGDTMPGVYLAFGIVSALLHAQRTGQGQFVDVCMGDAILAISERIIYHRQLKGSNPTPEGNFHPFFCPYGLYRASDGWVAIACLSTPFWVKLTQIMGQPELGERADMQSDSQRGALREFVNQVIETWTQRHTKKELAKLLGGHVPFGAVNTADDVMNDPHFRVRDMLIDVESMGMTRPPVTLVNTPIKMTGSPGGATRRAPYLGEHTARVMEEFGFKPSEIDALAQKRVVRKGTIA